MASRAVKAALYEPLDEGRSSDDEEEEQAPRAAAASRHCNADDFVELCLLGRGGVGSVYLVQEKHTENLFAMKVLDNAEMRARNKVRFFSLGESARIIPVLLLTGTLWCARAQVKRVLTEREILSTAKHPLVVTLYRSFQTEAHTYFVMEYCAGGTLMQTLRVRVPFLVTPASSHANLVEIGQAQPHHCLEEDAARFYVAEVLVALEYLHAMGFVYRDLKPENVLLHASGHVRLADFDLAKHAPLDLHAVASSSHGLETEPALATNSFVGTLEYFAPEMVAGRGHGAAVDWWALGVFLYELVYGATPFRGTNEADTLRRIRKEKLAFPECAPGQRAISKECKSLIRKLLERDPTKRLGHARGAAEIKEHAFFHSVDFPLILNVAPPVMPTAK